jgi:hypothetical protein
MNSTAPRGNTHEPPPIPSWAKTLALAMLALPILGLAAIAFIWAGGDERIKLCKEYYVLHAMAIVGGLDFLASYFLYVRTRLSVLIVSRLLSIAWVMIMALLLWMWVKNHMHPGDLPVGQ